MAYRSKAARNRKLLIRKRKIKLWWFRFSLGFCVAIVFFFAYSFYFNQSLMPDFVVKNIEQMSHKMGYLIKDIEVVGEDDNCQVANVSVLDKYKGTPTLLVSVDEIRADLENVDCIGKVAVTRLLPSKIKVSIVSRVPIAIWQHKHKFYFIASNGSTLKIRNSKDVGKFIIIVGENAPERTPELLALLHDDPDIYKKVVSAVWVGDRRWNIIFDNGTELYLPEEHYVEAWNKFVELSKNKEEFKRFSYRVVDLRVKNRIYAK